MTAQALHDALKGLVAGDAQQIRVASVVVVEKRRWIQIELVGPRHYSLLVSADLRRDPDMIRSALESWMTGDWTSETATISGVTIHNATIRLGVDGQPDDGRGVELTRSGVREIDRLDDRRTRRA
jgi:hypothetical protein